MLPRGARIWIHFRTPMFIDFRRVFGSKILSEIHDFPLPHRRARCCKKPMFSLSFSRFLACQSTGNPLENPLKNGAAFETRCGPNLDTIFGRFWSLKTEEKLFEIRFFGSPKNISLSNSFATPLRSASEASGRTGLRGGGFLSKASRI